MNQERVHTTNRPAGRDSADRLVAIAEVAETLGVDIRHVRRLVHERRIPYIKWGHLLRFDPAELEDWIDACRHRPTGGPND